MEGGQEEAEGEVVLSEARSTPALQQETVFYPQHFTAVPKLLWEPRTAVQTRTKNMLVVLVTKDITRAIRVMSQEL